MKNFTKYLAVLCLFLFAFSPNYLLSQCGPGQTLNTYCYDDGEVNLIAFEACPTAGMALESEIVQGSFFNGTNDNLTVYSGASGSGLGGTIVFGPMTGNLSGNTITSLGANQCLTFVINSNTFGAPLSCADGTELELQVCSQSVPSASVSFTAPADLCINAGVQVGLGGGIPTGGVYSGPGVTDDGNGMTYSFDPAAAGVGVHTLTYTNGGSATDDVEVFAVPTATFTAPADVCIDAGVQVGLGGGSPSGGIYAGPGVTDDGNGTTYSFNPAAAGLGVHTITYTAGGQCAATASDLIEVLAACGCPAPQTSFFHCSAGGESDLVIFEICPTAGGLAQATINAGTYSTTGNNLTIYQGAAGSGTGGTILYGPQTGDLTGTVVTGTAIDQCLIFVNNIATVGCQEGFETALEVCGESINAPVFFTAPGDLCINDGVQNSLSGGTPAGGVYSGAGVTDDGNGTTYSFDPAVAGVGTHTLTYTLGANTASDDIEVFAAPAVSFSALADLCLDAGIQTGLGGGTPVGGVYSGAGVTDDGNGMTYSFNPFAAGLGVHTIIYTEGGICMENATDVVEVTAACSCPAGEVTFFNCYDNNENNLVIFEVCPTAGQFAQAEISQGTYGVPDDFLTVYQGASGSSTGGTIVFGPLNGNLSGTNIISTTADECLIFVNNTGSAGSCADGFETPLVVCGSSLTSLVMFTALDDLSVNAGIQTGVSGGTPTGGVYSGPGVTDDGNGMTYTFDPIAAGIGVHTLTYTVGGNSASDDVEVLNLLPPSFSKIFNSNQIGPGSVSTLTFTINNSNSGFSATDLAFTDNLPAGMTIASPPMIFNDCSGATITAPAGGTTISVSDGSIGAGSTCSISVNVTSSTIGTHTNTTGDLTSSSGNSGTASANLQVLANRPGFSKSFSPSPINIGERSTLTFTIDNTANSVDHTNITFTDNLPAGMVVANPSNATITCGGGAITAVPGSSVISYTGTIFTDASVAAGATCTVSVDVIGGGVGQLDNVTDDLTSFNNFFQNFNSGKASASLEVLPPADIHIQKSFATNPVMPGGTTDLVFTITNFNRDFPATNIAFTDDLTSVLAGLTATGTPLNNTCGTGSSLTGTTLLTFTGGTIPADGSCTFSVPVQVPAGAASGTYTNVTSTITADINGSSITGNQATENLFVATLPTFTKTFLNDPISSGGTTTLEFTITNTSATSALTDITFSDPIGAFISGATITSVPPAGSCGASSIFFTATSGGLPSFQMNDGSIPAGGSCTFSIDLLIPVNLASGTYTNTTSFLSGTLDGNTVAVNPATDDLTVLAVPQLSKSFTDDPVNAGEIVNLEFTITYDENATGDATNISFTDDLNAVIPGLAAVGLPLNDICGTGATLSGTTNLMLSGGTLSPGGSCTFSVPVQVPAGVVTGSYTNTTSALTATVGGQAATGNTATDDLEIGGFSFTKEFLDSPVLPGQLTTLRFTFDNTSSFDATNIIFTDNLNTVLSGLTTEGTLPTGINACGASTVSGTTFFIYVGGTVSAGSSCSFDIPVRIPTGATAGTYNNITSNLSVVMDGTTRSLSPATAPLVVENNLISLTKTFTDDPVAPGGTVTVEYTLTNLDATNTINNIAFTDDFDGALTGLAATGLPQSACGGTVSGTGLLNFSGGSLAAGASCTFTVTLQTPASTPYGTIVSCPTSGVTGDIGGLPVIGDPADDDLVFQSFQLTKSLAGPVSPGESTTLTFTITNFDPINAISQISFTDDLDAFISGMTATTLPPIGSCGPLSEVTVTGTSVLNFGRGFVAGGSSCSFDVTVLIPCSTGAGTYTNTTSEVTADIDGTGVGITSEAATADLTVTSGSANASFTAPADLCINAGVQTGLGGGTPTGGVYSGAGVTDNGNDTYSFDPATAGVGTHTLTYTLTNSSTGCVTSASDNIEVFALPVVTFTAPADLCLNAGVQNNLGGGSPVGGTYSGNGVTDNGNGTYDFDPAAAGVGTHTLTYTSTDANGCSNSASDDVQVFAIPNTMFTAPADLCLNAGVQTGLGGGTPMGGIYSGNGVTDDGNGMTFSFDPAAAEVGTHTITYNVGVAGCSNSASDDIEVFALPTVTFTIPANQDEFCVDDPIVQISLAGNPSGGVFSGPGVTDLSTGFNFTFNPATAGIGTHTVTYTFTDANGCTNSATDNIVVNALPVVTFTALADLCLNDGVQNNLGGGTPTGGTYSGAGVTDDGNGMTYDFDPAAAGVGTHTITYTFTDGNGCTNSASDDVEVFPIPNTMLTAPADLCLNAGVQTGLGSGSPTGGVYSGPGVTDDGNGMTYSFDPSAAGVGTHTITYVVGVAGCSNSASDDIEVFALPTVTLNIPASQDEFCVDNSIVQISLAGNPSGGVFSGPGVTDLSTGFNFTFNPAAAGVGTHTVTYTFTDGNGCTNSATDNIVVNALPGVTFTALADLCLNDGVQNNLGGGTPTGGTYSGTGVTDDGNGMTYDFDPAAAGVGKHTITYTFTDGNGCTNSAFDDVEVFALPTATFTAPVLDVCIEDPTVTGLGGGLPMGGVYSGTGVTDDGNGMTFSFDPTAAAPNGGDIAVTYTFTDGNGCSDSASDDVFVNPICCVQTVTCPNPATFDCEDQMGITDWLNSVVFENCGDGVIMNNFDPADFPKCFTTTKNVTFSLINAAGQTVADCVTNITINKASTPTLTPPTFNSPISCQDAENFSAADATYTNNLLGGCNIMGSITADVIEDWNVCGGTITVSYSGMDECGNPLSVAPVIIEVEEAPEATVTPPTFPTSISCVMAETFSAADATYTNGLNNNCEISGNISATVTPAWDVCGGSITINYSSQDACGNSLTSGPFMITVDAAPEATVTPPTFPTSISCVMAETFTAADATYTNGLNNNCEISGNISATVTPAWDVCGGSITINYSSQDACGNSLTSGPFMITVNAAPEATVTPPTFPTSISCVMAETFTAADATYTNGLNNNCEISGNISATVTPAWDVCGGSITINYSSQDACGNSLTSGPFTITVDAAPEATVTPPTFPTSISCVMAETFTAADATYTNGLNNNCEISGNISATVTPAWDACGGFITVNYSSQDACGNSLTSGPFTITVDEAPEATVTPPTFPTSISCVMAETFTAADATYTNGLNNNCEISGNISATVTPAWDACGGFITINYSGQDVCGNSLTSGPFTINVNPAPTPTLLQPAYASPISCADADNFVASLATYTNGLTGACNISGTLAAGVDNNWDACGGTIVIHYFGLDDCGRFISIPSITIDVQPAPVPMISLPTLPSSVSCEGAATYSPPSASFDNGLTGSCNISGSLSAAINYSYDACGGVLEVIYYGTDNCGRNIPAISSIVAVDPAPAPTINVPSYPSELSCYEAEALVGDFATYSNGLNGDCEISGFLAPSILKTVNAGDGGTVTIIYSGEDECGNMIAATPIIISVTPATLPTVQLSDDPLSINCWEAENFNPSPATFSNGENGFCENSGELTLTTLENLWDECDGGYILLQFSGEDNYGNALQTDLYKIAVSPDNWPPQGECVPIVETIEDIKNTPTPADLDIYKDLIAMNYSDYCGAVVVTVVGDTGTPDCGLDGTFSRVYEVEITDQCGNVAGNCSITFQGNCNPLYCTLSEKFYSSTQAEFGGFTSTEMISELINFGANPITIGTGECGVTLNTAACIQAALNGEGQSISLPSGFDLVCGSTTNNNLVDQIITTTLNVRYNAQMNGSGIDYGNFQIDAACMYIPLSVANGLPDNATVNDLIDFANNFIGCQCSNTCGEFENVMDELTGILIGLNSRFNRCHVPGPCFLDNETETTEPEENPGTLFPTIGETNAKFGNPLDVKIFPNPTNNFLFVKMKEVQGEAGTIEIFDIQGRKLEVKTYTSFDQNQLQLDVQKYPQGMYWMRINIDGFDQVVKKFIIARIN